MLIRQSANTFIRTTEKYGCVTNQLTRHDRAYDQHGAQLLRMITRQVRELDEIIQELLTVYEDVERGILKRDIIEFLNSLEKDGFIVTGDTLEELNKKDVLFSYSVDNPRTNTDDFSQITDEIVNENTQDFFLEEIQGSPKISALQFELSSRCNERCIHCYIPNNKKDHGFDMPTAKIKSILDEFSALGGIHVTLSGGEAFLHKDVSIR